MTKNEIIKIALETLRNDVEFALQSLEEVQPLTKRNSIKKPRASKKGKVIPWNKGKKTKKWSKEQREKFMTTMKDKWKSKRSSKNTNGAGDAETVQ